MSTVFHNKFVGFGHNTNAWGNGLNTVTKRIALNTFTVPSGAVNFYKNNNEAGEEGRISCVYPLNYEQQNFSMVLPAKFDCELCLFTAASAFSMYGFQVDTPETGANTHSFKWKNQIDTALEQITVMFDEGTEVKSIPSAIINDYTLETADGKLDYSINFIGDRVSISGISAPISVTSPSVCMGDIYKISGLTMRLNDQSDGALDAGDTVSINKLTLNVNRNFEIPAQESGTSYIGEPLQGSTVPTLTIGIELRTKNAVNAAWFTKYNAGTMLKGDITITGVNITGTSTPYKFYIALPGLMFSEPVGYAFEGSTPVTAMLEFTRPAAAPTGMTYRDPYGYIINTLATLTNFTAIS